MRSIHFVIEGDPQGKGRHRTGRNGNYTPRKTVAYEKQIATQASLAMRGHALFEGAVSMRVIAHYAIPKSASKAKRSAMLGGEIRPTKKPDMDNVLKAIADGCNKVVYPDDSAIVSGSFDKFYSEKPRVEVLMTEMKEWKNER